MTSTYYDLYLEFRRALREEGASSFELEAFELVSAATGLSRERLVRDARLFASAETENRARALLFRRLSGEPLGYILGEWDFYGLRFKLTKDVLIPRADTEALTGAVIAEFSGRGGLRILDLCCGSGCAGIAAAKNLEGSFLVMGDVSKPALKMARENAIRLLGAGRAAAVVLDALEPPPHGLGRFGAIICNPPYIRSGDIAGLDASVRDFEPRLALDGGEDGLRFYSAVAALYRSSLEGGGALFFECGIGQAGDVSAILRENGYTDIRIIKDLGEVDRVVFALAPGQDTE